MAGARVALVGNNEQELKKVEQELKNEKLNNCCYVVADMRDADQVL